MNGMLASEDPAHPRRFRCCGILEAPLSSCLVDRLEGVRTSGALEMNCPYTGSKSRFFPTTCSRTRNHRISCCRRSVKLCLEMVEGPQQRTDHDYHDGYVSMSALRAGLAWASLSVAVQTVRVADSKGTLTGAAPEAAR